MIRKLLFAILYIILGLIVFGLCYFGTDAILSRIPVTVNNSSLPKDYDAFVLSNGVHTDIVLPASSDLIDWRTVFAPENTLGKDTLQQYVAIGWGDKGFYLNTPEWKDLKLSTALVAAFGLGESALHVTYYKNIHENDHCYKIKIDRDQYLKLIDYIQGSLDLDSLGKPILIQTNAQYSKHDAFYEAKGSYSMFYSCNTWTNNALKRAKMPSGVWTVFDKGILRHYKSI